ncbi:hypothetical protein K438DRAFT_1819058 [Mycena galopus ATCC 62051]|nr:hypothetical protein K438DRAFT_1819058 [Mycena galopus ATCC 62051]
MVARYGVKLYLVCSFILGHQTYSSLFVKIHKSSFTVRCLPSLINIEFDLPLSPHSFVIAESSPQSTAAACVPSNLTAVLFRTRTCEWLAQAQVIKPKLALGRIFNSSSTRVGRVVPWITRNTTTLAEEEVEKNVD